MRKILLIGSGGAGKSTLARQLGERLGIEVVHLDALYWKSGWVQTPSEEWQAQVQELLNREEWVMDGNFNDTMEMRMQAADTIIFLDFPRLLCMWRVLKRRYRYRGTSRPDMAEGCPERLDLDFLQWIWDYPHERAPRVYERMARLGADKRVIILHDPTDVRRLLQSLEK